MPQKQRVAIALMALLVLWCGWQSKVSSGDRPSSQTAQPTAAQIQNTNHPEPFSWDWFTRDGTVFFTGVLSLVACVQAGLFVWQLSYMRRGMKDAQLVAKATDLNARAAIALQLPLLRMGPNSLGHTLHSDGEGQTESCSVHFIDIINRGKTRAFPKEILYGWTVGDLLPEKPVYQFLEKFSLNSIIEPDAPNPLRQFLTFECLLKSGQWANICKGNYLWFYCDLIYDDFMGETRHQSFCWRWAYIGVGVAWRPDNTPAYNSRT
jgi:hypothetical protein